jgi:hypothetical protein
MHDRAHAARTGWALAKTGMLFLMLVLLGAFALASHVSGQSRGGRLACIENQHALSQAMIEYQMDHAGANPPTLLSLRNYDNNRSKSLDRCPVDLDIQYAYDRASGHFECTNPAHQIHS